MTKNINTRNKLIIKPEKNAIFYFLITILIFIESVQLISWSFPLVTLVGIDQSIITMHPATAIYLLMLTLSLVLTKFKYKTAACTLAAPVLLIGIYHLTNQAFFVNEQPMQSMPFREESISFGHFETFSFNLILSLIISSIILLLKNVMPEKDIKKRNNKCTLLYFLTITLIIIIGLSSIGFISSMPEEDTWNKSLYISPIAITALAIWSCAFLIILSRSQPATMLEILGHAPLIVFFSSAALFILIWYSLITKEKNDLTYVLHTINSETVTFIQHLAQEHRKAICHLASLWSKSDLTKQEWNHSAQAFVKDYPSIESIVWKSNIMNKPWAYPPTNNLEKTYGNQIEKRKEKHGKIATCLISSSRQVDGILEEKLINKGTRKNDGFILIYRYNIESTIAHSLKTDNDIFYQFNLISSTNQDKSTHQNELTKTINKRLAQYNRFFIGKAKYSLQISPTDLMINIYISKLPYFILMMGLFISLLFAILSRFWYKTQKAKAQLSLILHSAGEGIFGLSLDSRITFANTTACALLGYTASELIGKKAHPLLHHSNKQGKQYPAYKCPINMTLKTGHAHTISNEVFWNKQGKCFPVEYISRPILNKKNVLKGAVIVFNDITRRKYTETMLSQRTKKLEMANQELESFSYSVSHDLRAPLRHIVGFTDLITHNENIVLDKSATKHFEIIKNSATRMGHLIDDLLSYSRAGRFELSKTHFLMSELVEEVLTELQDEIKDRKITFNIDDLPSVYADREMLRTVLTNLFSNAIKFTRHEKKAIVEFHCKDNDNHYCFTCKDNGVGFNPEYKSKIFKVFQRLHKPSEFEGTGIGLANAARIITRHNGTIDADATPGEGACISFTLPKVTSS